MRSKHEVDQGRLARVHDLRKDAVLSATADIIALIQDGFGHFDLGAHELRGLV